MRKLKNCAFKCTFGVKTRMLKTHTYWIQGSNNRDSSPRDLYTITLGRDMSTHANEYCYDTSEEKYPLIESIEKRHLTIDPPFVHSHCATLLRYFFAVKLLRIFSWLFRKRYPYVLVLSVLKNLPNYADHFMFVWVFYPLE